MTGSFRFTILEFLSVLALLATIALVARAKYESRAEQVVAGTVIWHVLVLAPIYVLGLANRLTAASLGLASATLSLAVLAVASRGASPRGFAREIGRVALGWARLPLDAVLLAARRGSFVLLGIVVCAVLLPWSWYVAYLAPATRGFDALWYHEPIVGFTIQNHGFAHVDLPPLLQKVNGYPRLGEMVQLWFAIFTGRQVMDLPTTLVAPGLIASIYVMCMRHTRHKVVAMGWGVALMLMPTCIVCLQTLYVDVQNAAFLLAGAHFGTRPRLRIRDAVMAALALMLAVGSKHMSLVPVFVLGILAAVRVFFLFRKTRFASALVTIAGGFALIVGMAAAVYLRNYLHFKNPFWPDLKLDIDALGIHFPGTYYLDQSHRTGDGTTLDMNLPLSTFFEYFYALPWSVNRWHYGGCIAEYGIGVPWVVVPLGIAGAIVTGVWFARTAFLDGIRRAFVRVLAGEGYPILLVLTIAPMVYATPALWAARYHIATVGLFMVVACAATSHWPRAAEAAASIAVVTSLMTLWWAQPRWWSPDTATALSNLRYPEREVTTSLGSTINTNLGLAREKELEPGSVVVFNDEGAWVSMLWNNRFSNRVEYVPSGPDFLNRADALGATWIYSSPTAPLADELAAKKSEWEDLGTFTTDKPAKIYRRVRRAVSVSALAPDPR